jgi:UDP-N-acetylenolpyruvoylglucosamine reductase
LFYVSSVEKLIDELKKVLKKDDVIFTIGAGDVYKIAPKVKEVVSSLNRIKILENIDLKSFNTLKTSSIAQYFFEAKTKDDLVAAKKYSLEKKLPLLIIGGGSNLAILKEKIPGLVVKNSYQKLEVVEKKDDYVLILVSSGYPVSLLINQSIEKGWSGFEYHYGLPGTVGGAVYMNSKWTKPMTYFGDNLVFADLIDSFGKIKKVNRDYFQFAYDFSILQKTNEIFVEGIFKLKKDDPKKIKKKAMFSLEYRKKTQPFGVFSSGCFFKNPGNVSAGYLIDQTGLKGFAVGDFFVSPVHANFIVNKGNGKKEDLLKLLAIIKAKVKEKFNIQLEEEVKII